ncbi:MAG: 50S ribosomal protein L21 [candidate division WOR-3 bacterium]
MFAIAKIKGFQYLVKEGDKIVIPNCSIPEGETIKFDEIIFLKTPERTIIGNPTIKSASIEAKVLSHFKGKKVTIFKFRRRENYRRKRGHRDLLTKIEITKINLPD